MRLHYLLACLLYCAGIFWMSAQEALDVPPLFPGADKVIHFGIYGGLAALISIGLRRSGRVLHPAVLVALPVILATVYGVSDEFHQYFVPNRTCSAADVAADFLGALAAQTVLCLVIYRLPLFNRPSARRTT